MAPALTSVVVPPILKVKSTISHHQKRETDEPAVKYDYSFLKKSIENGSSSFSCAGLIPITTSTSNKNYGRVPTKSQPVSIFWTSKGSVPQKLVLPVDESNGSSSGTRALQQLVNDCSPATFGKNNAGVLDPTYRKAGKLEPAHFATTFHPADLGILDKIERKLLPSLIASGSRKLVADLYKLNIYSGPDGFFRKHIDTPRSANQVGSLVVCLPSRFTGGNLYVRHNKQVRDFDWSPASSSTIQWAAFYSDCEHEIGPATEGERITLTYNLYSVGTGSGRINYDLTLAPRMEPLKMALRDILECPNFMRQGGILGIFCAYAYPTASPVASNSIELVLKDGDYLLYSVLKSLGLDTSAHSISSTGAWYASILERAQLESIPTRFGKDKEAKIVASEAWPSITLPGVTWVNEQNRDEFAIMHLPRGTGAAAADGSKGGPTPVTFGNEPPSPPYGNDSPDDISPGKDDKSAVLQYADGAIFAVIPPWAVRV